MRKIALSLAILAVALVFAMPAQAQATRTWVSGVGDDANPCSRTAPCKTFAGAISKTATGGEINVLDPGGFGGVTITKSITISSEGFEAGVLVSGTNAIIINATTTSVVVLRGLDIEGLGTGLDGIKVLGGLAALHVEKCTINNFRGSNGSGIEIATSTGTTQVFIKDTIVRNNGQGTGGGILVKPSAAASVKAVLTRVNVENNTFGMRVDGTASTGGINVTVQDGSASGNTNASILSVSTGTLTQVMVDGTAISNNGFGPRVDGSNAIFRFGNSTVTGNGTGVSAVNAGQMFSYGNNQVDGNTALGITPAVIPPT